MNSTSPSPRCILPVLFLSLLLAGTTFAQGTVPKFLFVANYVPQGEHILSAQALNGAGKRFSLTRSLLVSGSDSASCADRGIVPSVSICAPLAGSVTPVSIHVIACAHSDGIGVIASTAIYLDEKEVYSVASGTVNTYINTTPAMHHITVQSTDSSGFAWSSTVYIATE
jgi:hypothetical protein